MTTAVARSVPAHLLVLCHECETVISSRDSYCMVLCAHVQLGYGDSAQRSVPPSTDIAVGGVTSSVACGMVGQHVCIVMQLDGSVKCWCV